MSNIPSAEAGPSSQRDPTGPDGALLRQFVMEYLQSHGFERALDSLTAGITEQANLAAAAGEGDGHQREAIIRAPQPVPIESTLKRNIPQAQTISASTLSERITPEFEAQARYIIEQLQKKAEAVDEAMEQEVDAADRPRVTGEGVLDPHERVEGYRRYRRWVDQGLDLWKTELDSLCFPLYVYTFLDLLAFGFKRAARQFFDNNRRLYEEQHSSDLAALSAVSSRLQIKNSQICQRFLSGKYTVTLSRNPHDLLLQWLSGAGLDEDWEAGLHTSSGRAKEAVKAIIFNRITISVSPSPMPLDKITIASTSGLHGHQIPSTSSVAKFNSATVLKLGRPPLTDKLKEQMVRTLQDSETASTGDGNTARPNGDGVPEQNGASDGDVEMQQPAQQPIPEIKLEDDTDPTVLTPDGSETIPPIPAVFRTADLKREVEAVRDKRKMIRLGPDAKQGQSVPPTTVLPSVVAFTVFDGGEGVSSVEFSQDSSLMAVGSAESSIRVWSVKGEKLRGKTLDPRTGGLMEDEGQPHRKLIGHSGPVYSLSFDPLYGSAQSPSALLSSSQDGTVRLWSMDTYSNLVVYRGHSRDPVWDVQWGPMGVYFASGSRDRSARLWSSDRVTPLRMYTGHLSDVNCVRFHPNSLYLATGSADNSCRLWDVQRGACIRLFLGHSDAVTTMAISPDGKTLASAGVDKSIWLWDLGSSRPIKKMTGHRAPIHSLSFSAESSVLVSGSADCTVRCWDVKSAGGDRARGDMGSDTRRGVDLAGSGRLPMGPGEMGWDEASTSDLLSTFSTKRTPILNVHYTPRNLCMAAGVFIPPSNSDSHSVPTI